MITLVTTFKDGATEYDKRNSLKEYTQYKEKITAKTKNSRV